MEVKIGVLGAGVVGLSTATQLQSAFPKASISIIAKQFYDETTSFGAAGIFRPTMEKLPAIDINILREMLKDSWNHYDHLIHSADASEAGVQALSGYQFKNNPIPNLLEQEFVYNCRQLTQKELNTFPGIKYKHGWFVTSIVVEPGRYLPYLLKKFREKGGTVIRKELKSLEELVGSYDLVVNCLGLGNRSFLNDPLIYPVRGHLVKVRAPWLKHFVYTGDHSECYIVPGIDVVSIGGTRTKDDYSMDLRKEDTEAIMQRASLVVPSLEKAEILYEWVGLRPCRAPLRVEGEVLKGVKGSIKIIHNYGHGGEGVSLSWGSGMRAVRLVKEMLGVKSSL